MDHGAIDAIFIILSSLGGVAGIIAASGWARAVNVRAERAQTERASKAASDPARDSAVLGELKALKQQIAEMHSTSHQFDLSFDEALNRMEERVGRVETKVASVPTAAPRTEEVQRAGLR